MRWLEPRKIWLFVGLVALVVAGVVFVIGRRAKPSAIAWTTATVDRGRIVARVTATGTLSALVTVQVGSQVSGRIQHIDPQLFQAALAQARANYLAAQGNLRKAKVQAEQAAIDFKRQADLAARNLIAQSDYDTAKSNLAAAQAQVEVNRGNLEQAEAALTQARVNLAYTNIVSPTDGVVISRNVDVGQTVAASLSAPILFVIAQDLRQMQVDTNVAEADVGRLQPGMEATFTVDAFPNQRFTGKVRQIRNAALTVQNVVTYDAVIDVDNAHLELRPGMTANVSFIYADRENVLRIPNAALRFQPSPEVMAAIEKTYGPASLHPGRPQNSHPDGGAGPPGVAEKSPRRIVAGAGPASASHTGAGQRTVWALRDGVPQAVAITVGPTDGRWTEVVAGPLTVGDSVVTDAALPAGANAASGSGRGGRRYGLF
jgi:HlyD family secretion protein